MTSRKSRLSSSSISWAISLPDATAKVYGFTPHVEVSVSHRSTSIPAKMYGSILAVVPRRHLHSCRRTVQLQRLHQTGGVHRREDADAIAMPYKPEPFIEQPTFEDVKVSKLESPALLKYLADRGIPRNIASGGVCRWITDFTAKTTMPSVSRTTHMVLSFATPSTRVIPTQAHNPHRRW